MSLRRALRTPKLLRRREVVRVSNGSVLRIFTRKHRGQLLAVCAVIAACWLAGAVALALAWPPTPPTAPDRTQDAFSVAIDRTALNCVFGVVFSLWGVMAYLRCLDPRISRRLAAIAVTLTLWLLAVTIKWNTSDLALARYLWYSYYIPMALVPPLCLSCALRSAGVELGKRRAPATLAATALGATLSLLALTNDLHQLFFTFETPSPGIVGTYSYGPAYYAFFAYSALCYLAFFCVLWRSSRSALRGVVVPAAAVALAGLLYFAAYALQAPLASSLNFSLVYGILVIVVLELCLDLGLIPSTRSFGKVFDGLPFDLKIISRNGDLFRKTEVAEPLRPEVAMRMSPTEPASFALPYLPDAQFVSWPLSGGMALLTQNMGPLRRLNRTLEKRNAELERDRQTLEHDRELAELLANLEAESALVDDVDKALSASMSEVTTLLKTLPEEPCARRRQLERARMLVAYCKRKGSLVLAEAADPEIDRDRIRLIANELACDLRAVGIDCAAITNLCRPVPAQQASTLYDCIYDMAAMAFDCTSPALIYHLGERDDGMVELRANLQSDDDEDLGSRARTQALRERLDACDVIYSLTGDVGQLVLVARVRGGGDA